MDKKRYLFFILYILTFIFLFLGIIFVNYRFVFVTLLTFFFFFLISFLEKIFNLNISFLFKFLMEFFLFLALICGEILDFYSYISFFDNMLHYLAGFISGCLGFSFFNCFIFLFNKRKVITFFSLIFIVCFSMSIGVFWEFFEFSVDKVLHFDMQKDTLINYINSIYLNNNDSNIVLNVQDIIYTDIHTDDFVIRVNDGYLDIGLYDTIEDMFFNMLGAFTIFIFYILNFSFVNKFVISLKK